MLRKEKLFAAKQKCEFGAKEVKFLGYVISDQVLSVDIDKVKSIRSWLIPTTV